MIIAKWDSNKTAYGYIGSSESSSGVDQTARNDISDHIADSDVHATADEKAAWNAKFNYIGTVSDLFAVEQTCACGYNGDTLNTPYAAGLTGAAIGLCFVNYEASAEYVTYLVIPSGTTDCYTAVSKNGAIRPGWDWRKLGGNADTVNNKNVFYNSFSEPGQFGASLSSSANEIWQAMPNQSIFIVDCNKLSGDGWNFPVDISLYTLLIMKNWQMRPAGIYLYPKTSGAIYYATIDDTGNFAGIWHNIADGGNANTLDGLHANEIASNPNLLDNSNFKINQRGEAIYTAGYTVDRWKTSNLTVTVTADGLQLDQTDSAKAGQLIQEIELDYSALSGRYVTISITSAEGTTLCATEKIPEEAPSADTLVARAQSADTNYKADFHATSTGYYVAIRIVGSSPIINNIKLEVGNVATPFCPPDPTTEISRCQRYLQKLSAYSLYRAVYVLTDYIDFSIPTPTTMKAGAISMIGTPEIIPFPISSAVSGFSFEIMVYGQNQLLCRATKSAHGLTDAVLRVPSGTFILLSAEP